MNTLKNEYKDYLIDELEKNPEKRHDGNLRHAIYMIDDIIIGGDFYGGVRGNDHNALAIKDYSTNEMYFKNESGERITITWDDIIKFGTIIVPETMTYINNYNIEQLDNIGYDRLGYDSNHIVGWKN